MYGRHAAGMTVSPSSQQTVPINNRPVPLMISFGCFLFPIIFCRCPHRKSVRAMYTFCRDLSPVQTADVIGRRAPQAHVTTRRGFAQVSDHSVPRSGKRHSSHHLSPLSFLFISTHVHTIHYALRNLHLKKSLTPFIFGRRGVIGSESASEAAPYGNSRGQIKGEGAIRVKWEIASDERHRLTTTSEHDVTEKAENVEAKKVHFKPLGQMGCPKFRYTIRPQND